MLLDKCPTAQALPQLRMVALWFSKLVNLEDIEGLDEAATACRPGLFAGMNTGRLDLNLAGVQGFGPAFGRCTSTLSFFP